MLKKQGMYLPEFEHDNCGAGFICSLEGNKSNDIIHKALQILERLEHRGAVSSDGKTGDGAGILTDIPHELFVNDCSFDLPSFGQYATANVFLPKKENQRNYCVSVFENYIKEQGLNVLGWREVPVDATVLGSIAQETEPCVKQIFIAKSDEQQDDFNFNLKLLVLYTNGLLLNKNLYIRSLLNNYKFRLNITFHPTKNSKLYITLKRNLFNTFKKFSWMKL